MKHWIVVFLLACASAAAAPTFEFHSSFWLNLHHFLYEQASAKTPPASISAEWDTAVDYYRREVISANLLSPEAGTVNDALSAGELPAPLAAVLERAAPVYRARWWPEHDRGNRAWIAAISPLVAKYEDALKKQLAIVYQTEWPSEPIRTDVAEYADSVGAYTTLRPTHITISSTNPAIQGEAALEILFHEASHAMFEKVGRALSTEVRAQHRLFRRSDFWHAVLFYTTGEVVRRQLKDYIPYALKNGVYNRAWKGVPEILDADWKPYIDGRIDLMTAVRRVVDDYGIPEKLM